MNRITGSNYEESLRATLVNKAIENTSLYDRIFYFGQVIDNTDAKNLNRIKIRIPILDDVFYVNATKEEGDKKLPYCLPISHRFIDIPEVNSIIIVAILDTKVPFYGRVYFDTVTELSDSDIFKRLTPESNSLSDFTNVEKAFNVKLNSKPKDNDFNSKNNTNYSVGIRGKGKNKFLLGQTSGLWIQNEGDSNNESSITLTSDPVFKAAKTMELISTIGSSTKYHPVFDAPLHTYLASMNSVIQKIIMVLNSVPAISPVGPCTASPTATQLISALEKMSEDFTKFKQDGHSAQLKIN